MKRTLLSLLLFSSCLQFGFAQWVKQNSNMPAGIAVQNISIVDPNIVWAAGVDTSGNPYQGYTKTTNGGTTWTAGTITGSSSTYYIANISATSSTTASAAMFSTSGGGAIYRTTNGGSSWTKTSGSNFAAPNGWPNFIYFFDANNGVCMGDPNGGGTPAEFEILTTTNGGSSWTRVAGANIANPSTGEYGITNTFSSKGNKIWFGTNKTRVYYSTDKGANWNVKKVTTAAGTGSIYRLNFQDETHGFAIYLNAAGNALAGISKTTDGGATWTDFTGITGGENFYLSDHSAPQSNFLVSAGGNNTGISTDYGASWSPGDSLPLNEVINAITFYSNALGWAGTISSGTGNGGIYKFTDPSSGIADHINKDVSVDIFPNPGSGKFTLEVYSKEKQTELAIYDITGKAVYINKNISPSTRFKETIDLTGQPRGLYLVTTKNGGMIYTQKLIIE